MAERRCDVLVAGGGPAGASAAKAAAEAGVRVILVDAKRRFGDRPHCAEYVPRMLALEMDLPERSVVQGVEAMETAVGGRTFRTRAPGFILDRAVFDHGLAAAAARSGAEPMAATRVVGREGDVYVLRGPRGEESVRPGVVVAADGAGSRVRKLAGRPKPDLLTGVQVEVPLTEELARTLVFFDQVWRYGYAWLFPRRGTANVGLGMAESYPGEARAALDDFTLNLRDRGLIRPGVLARTGGAIVAGGPPESLVAGNVIFTGDAAGLGHPITGAGIPQAVFSGLCAGRAAAAFVRDGEPGALASYEREIRQRYGRTLERARRKRKILEEQWDDDDFAGLVRRTWPAFREYRDDD